VNPSIHLVIMTYNRLEYTKLALPRLLEDPGEEFRLTIWDNASSDGTQDFLRSLRDRRIDEIVFSPENKGQSYVTNRVWGGSSAELVGKVDNDCLVTPGWTRILSRAHSELPELGVIGCWHFFEDDFDYERARVKIQQFGAHRIFRHPWVDGSALLVKRAVYEKFAPCREEEYLSDFWLRLARAGYVNGYYYPLVLQEHMDDPKSDHTLLKDEQSYRKAIENTHGLRQHRITTLEERWRFRERVLRNLLDEPWEANYYTRARLRVRRMGERFRELLARRR
jgi:GT2 family glycosyltransferase